MRNVWFLLSGLILMSGVAGAATNGVPDDGVYRTYYSSGGILREENYKFRKLDGLVTEYYETGTRKSEDHYVAGVREGVSKGYYPAGVVKTDGFYHDNKLEGVLKIYDPSGFLRREETYVQGILNGEAREYYPSGALRKKMYYVKAVLNGSSVEFYEDGKLKAQETYKDGERVSAMNFESAADLMSKASAAKNKNRETLLKAGDKSSEAVKAEKKPVVEKTTRPEEGIKVEMFDKAAEGTK